jgi:hypothetical protein
MLTAILRASSLLSSLATDRRPPLSLNSNLTANPTWAALGAIMNTTKPLGLDEIEISSEVDVRRNIRERDQVERGDLKASAEELAALMRRLSDAS